MIEEVRLKNWKSFEDTVLYIEPLTAIIGCNASGKSNIFDALKFVSLLANGYTIFGAIDETRGKEEYIVRKGQEQASIELKIHDDETDTDCVYSVVIDTNIGIGGSHNVNNVIKLQNIFLLNPNPQTMRDYSPLGKDLKEDASNIAGILAALDEEQGKTIQERITKLAQLLPEKDIVEVWSEKVGRLGKDAMIYCKERWTNDTENILDASGMSDGTLRFIAIITALLTRPEGSLLMVEEIDNGLHPSRVKDLVKALKEIGAERNIDILFTTHNPALIDALGSELIPCINYIKRNPDTGSSEINTLDQNENLFQIISRGSIGDSMIEGRI